MEERARSASVSKIDGMREQGELELLKRGGLMRSPLYKKLIQGAQ